TLLKTKEMIQVGVVHDGILQLLLGTVVAFVSGYFAIKFLLNVLERGKLSWFAFYCLAAGVLGILFI
ncbi:MAG: undecaprenyl-diphosphate phosphatase, partial [Bacteroidota bacterium]